MAQNFILILCIAFCSASNKNDQKFHNAAKKYKNKANRPINLDMFARVLLEIRTEERKRIREHATIRQRKMMNKKVPVYGGMDLSQTRNAHGNDDINQQKLVFMRKIRNFSEGMETKFTHPKKTPKSDQHHPGFLHRTSKKTQQSDPLWKAFHWKPKYQNAQNYRWKYHQTS